MSWGITMILGAYKFDCFWEMGDFSATKYVLEIWTVCDLNFWEFWDFGEKSSV